MLELKAAILAHPASSWQPQPQQSQGQCLSRVRVFYRNALWLCFPSLSLGLADHLSNPILFSNSLNFG